MERTPELHKALQLGRQPIDIVGTKSEGRSWHMREVVQAPEVAGAPNTREAGKGVGGGSGAAGSKMAWETAAAGALTLPSSRGRTCRQQPHGGAASAEVRVALGPPARAL